MAEQIQIVEIAGVVVKQNDKYLLIQENRPNDEKVHGKWNLPAGKVDLGETIEQAAVREAKEESGYNVEIIRKLAVFTNEYAGKTLSKNAFEAKIIDGEVGQPDEATLDVKWFTWEEIQSLNDKLRDKWVLGAIQILENNK